MLNSSVHTAHVHIHSKSISHGAIATASERWTQLWNRLFIVDVARCCHLQEVCRRAKEFLPQKIYICLWCTPGQTANFLIAFHSEYSERITMYSALLLCVIHLWSAHRAQRERERTYAHKLVTCISGVFATANDNAGQNWQRKNKSRWWALGEIEWKRRWRRDDSRRWRMNFE